MKYLVQVMSGEGKLLTEVECLEWQQVYQELTLKHVWHLAGMGGRGGRSAEMIVLLGRDANVFVTEVWADETP